MGRREQIAVKGLIAAADHLSELVDGMRFGPPVTHVYNPLSYARGAHLDYLKRYAGPPKEAVLVGMNPGPWGMAQTGVPFGAVPRVRDWLGIHQPVTKPTPEHPKRPVEGFHCRRVEVSGDRLWGWAEDRFGAPEAFFARFFVWNYCPLSFMEETGRNRTPDKLPAAEREPLFAACNQMLRTVLDTLRPRWAIGIGAFAEGRIRAALGPDAPQRIGRLPHPSPASPTANRGWAEAANRAMAALGIEIPGAA